jgi:hypothetical protein
MRSLAIYDMAKPTFFVFRRVEAFAAPLTEAACAFDSAIIKSKFGLKKAD